MKKSISLQLNFLDREGSIFFDSIENTLLIIKKFLKREKQEITEKCSGNKPKSSIVESIVEAFIELRETENITYTGIFLFLFTKCETVLEDVVRIIKTYNFEKGKEKKPIEEKIYVFLGASLEEEEYKKFKIMRLENNSIKHQNCKPKKCLYEEAEAQYENRHLVMKQEFDDRSNEEKEEYRTLDTEKDNEDYYLVEPKDKYRTTTLMNHDKVQTRIEYARNFFAALQKHLCDFIHDKESAS